MNEPQPQSNSKVSGCKFPQPLVNQTPVYDRKLKVHRPRKTAVKKPKFL